jgi:site-specific DNA recombinase
MKLIAYLRVSTQSQDKNGFSLESQKASIIGYCNLYNHEIIAFKQDKATGSVKNKGLKSLLKKLYNEGLDGIIVDKIDRLFRNAMEVLKTVDELNKKGKILISVKEQFDISTPSGQLSVAVISAFAEFEKNRIRERILTGKHAKKEAGGFTGGTVPFGKKAVTQVTEDGKYIKVLLPDEKEQNIIEIIKVQRQEGNSFSRIAAYLNENGYKTKRNKLFTATQVFRVIKNNGSIV